MTRLRNGLAFAVMFALTFGGCSQPVERAAEQFRECLIGFGAEIDGWGAGFDGDDIGVDASIIGMPERRALGVANACADRVSNELGRVVFTRDIEVAP